MTNNNRTTPTTYDVHRRRWMRPVILIFILSGGDRSVDVIGGMVFVVLDVAYQKGNNGVADRPAMRGGCGWTITTF